MRTRQPGGLPTTLLTITALTLVGTVGACGNRPGTAASSTGPAVAASADNRAAEAEQAALTAYAGYLGALRGAESAGDPHDPQLARYLADPLLTRVRLAIRDAKENGAMRTGKLVSDPTVTEVSLDTVPVIVSIQDCLDATRYRLVYRENRREVPDSARGRYVATATVTRYPDGRWLVNKGAVHQDQPC